ncbi:hypothetical protein MHSWG343_06330 [Candidatus Mycoplasma haematohominis]|uniref:Uncharacterized protein n=1 Tax=Candidatus Mycoplasma haematohominis TaxID=1494318 RepID=A0A478FTB7_9MOLU|nr:hypothetical protein MHSWG343_06330 [Candidatus Mycoplasma haemohominis]
MAHLGYIAASIGVVVVATAAGWGVSNLLISSMPAYVVLSEGVPNGTTYTDDNIGKIYGDYLIAPYGSNESKNSAGDSNSNNNKEWWEWSYALFQEDLKSESLQEWSDEFREIESAFSTTSALDDSPKKDLNQVCEAVYKKNKKDLKPSKDKPNNAKLINNFWRYCSFFHTKPRTIEENQDKYDGVNKYGNLKKSSLISTDLGKWEWNASFWEARNKEFLGNNGEKSNTKATKGSKFELKGDEEEKHIKDICSNAYNSEKDNNNDYPEADVTRFCTLEGK